MQQLQPRMNESDSALAGVLRDRQGGASVYLKLVRRRRRPHKHPSVGTLSHTPHITLQRRPATASDRRVSPEVQQPPTDAEMYLCSVATFFCCWAIVLVKTHPHILPSLHAGDQHVKVIFFVVLFIICCTKQLVGVRICHFIFNDFNYTPTQWRK